MRIISLQRNSVMLNAMKKINSSQTATKSDTRELKAGIKKIEQSAKTSNKKLRNEFSSLRSDLKSTKKSLFGQMLKLEENVESIDENQKRSEGKLDKLQNTLDSFLGRITNLEDENSLGTDQYSELDKKVNAHEKRIKHLEVTQPV